MVRIVRIPHLTIRRYNVLVELHTAAPLPLRFVGLLVKSAIGGLVFAYCHSQDVWVQH